MHLTINGENHQFEVALTLSSLLKQLDLDGSKVAIERNLEIVPKSTYDSVMLADGDKLEIVHFIGGGHSVTDPNSDENDNLIVAGRTLKSRLIVGTGKYKDFEETKLAIEASGADMVTVAVRRVNITDRNQPMLVDYVDPKKYVYLPNTAFCYTADEALRTLRLAREAGGWDLVKLEVLGHEKTLYPNMVETLKAARTLIDEGFKVMVYCSDDPIMCQELEDMGCVAIMPLGAPIGSGLGIQNPVGIGIIKEQAKVPVIVDAGVGTASDATIAMELGCDGVLMNTAIAHSPNPITMASAMKDAVTAGRKSFLAGRMPRKSYADPSSPRTGLI
ncbi:sulfur carrier protein ThiS [Sneathiella limimaris]|uniref:sulfur carrier protein ThiS n=1 Tax=Sneathiella limimaris TaxID=1964213 RepID=UPI00146BB0C2|nr:sulfur carrier protein ThiS [Sneathiella limimaris]